MNTDRFRGVILGRMAECGIRTQAQLAKAIKVSPACLSTNLNHPDTMSLDTYARLTAYLDMSAEDMKRAIR